MASHYDLDEVATEPRLDLDDLEAMEMPEFPKASGKSSAGSWEIGRVNEILTNPTYLKDLPVVLEDPLRIDENVFGSVISPISFRAAFWKECCRLIVDLSEVIDLPPQFLVSRKGFAEPPASLTAAVRQARAHILFSAAVQLGCNGDEEKRGNDGRLALLLFTGLGLALQFYFKLKDDASSMGYRSQAARHEFAITFLRIGVQPGNNAQRSLLVKALEIAKSKLAVAAGTAAAPRQVNNQLTKKKKKKKVSTATSEASKAESADASSEASAESVADRTRRARRVKGKKADDA